MMGNSQSPTLVVENDAGSRRALRRLLSSFGHKVVAAANLEQARRHLAGHPKVVILNLMLPDGNGIEILRKIRHDQSKAVVLVVSGANDDKLREAIELKPDALFGKPVDIEDFRDWLIHCDSPETDRDRRRPRRPLP
jgi:DNA-binding response OmpR family regulator